MSKKVRCPHCGYSMPILYVEQADCHGVIVKCKGRNCGKEFEVKIKRGEQIK